MQPFWRTLPTLAPVKILPVVEILLVSLTTLVAIVGPGAFISRSSLPVVITLISALR